MSPSEIVDEARDVSSLWSQSESTRQWWKSRRKSWYLLCSIWQWFRLQTKRECTKADCFQMCFFLHLSKDWVRKVLLAVLPHTTLQHSSVRQFEQTKKLMIDKEGVTLKQWQEKVPSCSSHFPKLPQGANEQRRGGRGLEVTMIIVPIMIIITMMITIIMIIMLTCKQEAPAVWIPSCRCILPSSILTQPLAEMIIMIMVIKRVIVMVMITNHCVSWTTTWQSEFSRQLLPRPPSTLDIKCAKLQNHHIHKPSKSPSPSSKNHWSRKFTWRPLHWSQPSQRAAPCV